MMINDAFNDEGGAARKRLCIDAEMVGFCEWRMASNKLKVVNGDKIGRKF